MDRYAFKTENFELFRDRLNLLYPQTKDGKFFQNETFHSYNFEDSNVLIRLSEKLIFIFPNENYNFHEVTSRLEKETWAKMFGAMSNGN